MAERPVWRGHLRLALVSCPVALHSVLRASGNLHFHFINPKTGHRVRMVTLDAETDEEVSRRELVKGYEFEKDRYVLLDDEDFANAKIETSSTMTVGKFVARDAIQPIYFDTSYYVCRMARRERMSMRCCGMPSRNPAGPLCHGW
jgi:DNA end-binding protein Ku